MTANYTSPEAIAAFGRYARVFDYELIDEPLRGIYLVPQEVGYEMLKSFCTKIGKPELARNCVIEYVQDSRFQAFAAKQGSYYFIGISAALPALLQAMLQNLFTFTNPFTAVVEDESARAEGYVFPNRLMAGFFQPDELRAEIIALIRDTLPKERWQRVMASKMAEIAICFCIAHEIGHLISGHTDIVEHRAITRISETGPRDLGQWLSQAFELQADRLGIALLYSYVIGTPRNRKKFMHYLRCKHDPGALYGRTLYSVYLVFLLLGQQQSLINIKGSHPAPITRISFIMAFLGTVMVNQEHYDPIVAGDLVEYFAELAEAAWENLGFPNGRNPETIEDLPAVVKDLQRAVDLTVSYFKNKEWAVRFR